MSVAKRVALYLGVLILIVILGCGGTIVAGFYTNGFESVKSRYITYAGRAVNEKVGLTIGEENAEITLAGAGFTAVDWGDYAVSITANPAAGITCTINNGEIEIDGEDLTEAFKIERSERSFVIIADDYRIEKVLKNLYGDRAVITADGNVPPYVLTVTDGKGKSKSYQLNYSVEVEGIKGISPDKIVAG